MILKFKVNNRLLSVVDETDRKILVADLDLPCGPALSTRIFYVDTEVEQEGVKLVKIVLCSNSRESYICSAVAEVKDKVVTQGRAEEIYQIILGLVKQASPCNLPPSVSTK
jgi:hypothetical protein